MQRGVNKPIISTHDSKILTAGSSLPRDLVITTLHLINWWQYNAHNVPEQSPLL